MASAVYLLLDMVFEPTTPRCSTVPSPFRNIESAPRECPPPSEYTAPQRDRFKSRCITFQFNQGHMVMKEHTSQSPFTTALIAGKLRFIFLHSSQAPFCTLWEKKTIVQVNSPLRLLVTCYHSLKEKQRTLAARAMIAKHYCAASSSSKSAQYYYIILL